MSEAAARKRGLKPLARILAYASHAAGARVVYDRSRSALIKKNARPRLKWQARRG